MSALSCNGEEVLEMRLTLPVSGRWVAELEVATDDTIAGAVTLSDDGASYAGYVARSGQLAGSCRLELVGGAGGLSQDVTAKSYQGVAARSVIADLLAEVGETLAGSSSASVLNTILPYWTRAAESARTALSSLADALSANWRILPSGEVWIGLETWPAASAEFEQEIELDRDDAAGTVVVSHDSIGLAPGVTLMGYRVGRVEHHVSREEFQRTTFWVEP